MILEIHTGQVPQNLRALRERLRAAPSNPGVRGGMYSRRAAWIHDGLADLEYSALSCLLRAPAGGEARGILSRMPARLTIKPLDELAAEIRSKLARGRWDEIELRGDLIEWLKVYSLGPKCNFTDHERKLHEALLNLLLAEGGHVPWT